MYVERIPNRNSPPAITRLCKYYQLLSLEKPRNFRLERRGILTAQDGAPPSGVAGERPIKLRVRTWSRLAVSYQLMKSPCGLPRFTISRQYA